jgi:hypothetical protein
VGALCTGLPWALRDNGGEMAPGFAVLTAVRKEVRGVGVRTALDIVDGDLGNTGSAKLKPYERREVSVRFRRAMSNDGAAVGSPLDF